MNVRWFVLAPAMALAAAGGAQAPVPTAPAVPVVPHAEPAVHESAEPTAAQDPSAAAARAGADRALAFLVATQHPDGSWGTRSQDSLFDGGYAPETYYSYQVGAHAIATLALLRAPDVADRRAALERAAHWLVATRMPLRGSDWDNDAVWSWLYGTVALTEIQADARFRGDVWASSIGTRGREFVRWLERNQVPTGGFGYYDDPTFSQRPKWATSFATSAVLPALGIALQLGWAQDPQVLRRAIDYVKRCRLPSGAYQYDLDPIPRENGGENINDVRGSLGRIQVANWSLCTAGDADTTLQRVRDGVELFFAHHEFLQVARMRPIPHEAYYANAGYFYFFGHFYCSQAINLLPEAERAAWHARLRPFVLAAQRPDGSFCDFLGASYMTTSSTAFAAMALLAGL